MSEAPQGDGPKVDAGAVLRAHVQRAKQELRRAADANADLIVEVAHLEAYIQELRARVAELEQSNGGNV